MSVVYNDHDVQTWIKKQPGIQKKIEIDAVTTRNL